MLAIGIEYKLRFSVFDIGPADRAIFRVPLGAVEIQCKLVDEETVGHCDVGHLLIAFIVSLAEVLNNHFCSVDPIFFRLWEEFTRLLLEMR